ncbi:acyltransferase family protein [Cytobacillus sp. FJAT-54145]|uniref:Acyltransferase family protein n=1 Tax=Cytobacillus spartinae TaxID=3299023 RepID=A0ABW6KJ45_9BACI
MGKRLYYLDYLRVILTILVIFHHTAIAYGAGGSWIYKDVDDSELTISMILLTIFTAINQSFFMGFFFFLSGYFTPGSYDRKGWKSFLKERFLRLGIPLLIYIFFLGPIITYAAHFKETMSLWEYYQSSVVTLNTIHIGPLWFVEALLYFNLLYVLYRFVKKSDGAAEGSKIPSFIKLILVAILLGAIAFLVRVFYPVGKGWLGLQFGYFPSYILLFIAGMVAFRNHWLEQLNYKLVKKWSIISLITIPILPIALIAGGALDGTLQFEGGMNLQAFVYAMWEPFVAIGIILWLLKYFEKNWNEPSAFKNTLANSAYTVYIIHPVIIVSLSLLITRVTIYPTMKFFIVSIIGSILCFVVANVIIKIPYAKRIL